MPSWAFGLFADLKKQGKNKNTHQEKCSLSTHLLMISNVAISQKKERLMNSDLTYLGMFEYKGSS